MLKGIRKQQGFTIIEVLIVLAIAGLIMLIVFLAVPALQRNSRNNGRNSDASRIATAARECLTNYSYEVSSCTVATIQPGDFSQLEDFVVQQFFAGSTDRANVLFGFKCNDTGTGWSNTGNNRHLIVIYQNETSDSTVQRCLDG